MKFITQFSYERSERSFERPGSVVSETIPSLAHSVRDLLVRFQAGTMPPVQNNNMRYGIDGITISPLVDITDSDIYDRDINSRLKKPKAPEPPAPEPPAPEPPAT